MQFNKAQYFCLIILLVNFYTIVKSNAEDSDNEEEPNQNEYDLTDAITTCNQTFFISMSWVYFKCPIIYLTILFSIM